MGTAPFAVNTLLKLFNEEYDIVAVFTNKDKPFGRKQELKFSDVKKVAMKLNLPIFQPDRLKEEEIEILKELGPDFIVVVAYGKILPKEVLEIPKYGCFNLHASLLPKYRGASPIQASIVNCDEETGVCVIAMTENLDDGDILKMVRTEIGLNETFEELSKRLSEIGATVLLEVLREVEKGSETRTKQDEEKKSYVGKIVKEMGRINFDVEALRVHKLICGYSFWPSAYRYLGENILKVYKSVLRNEYCGKPGEILDDRNFIVGCKEGAVEFLEVQLQGKKRMNSRDFLNGCKIKKGQILK